MCAAAGYLHHWKLEKVCHHRCRLWEEPCPDTSSLLCAVQWWLQTSRRGPQDLSRILRNWMTGASGSTMDQETSTETEKTSQECSAERRIRYRSVSELLSHQWSAFPLQTGGFAYELRGWPRPSNENCKMTILHINPNKSLQPLDISDSAEVSAQRPSELWHSTTRAICVVGTALAPHIQLWDESRGMLSSLWISFSLPT